MDVNLEYYKVFYYVVKYNGITAAAEALSISQPAVSQAIKQLEQSVAISLFNRTPKGVRLTKEGAIFYEYIKNGYEKIKMGERRLEEMQNLELGEIKIGASDMTLQFYLLPYLEKFNKKHPEIKIGVSNAPTPATLCNLDKGEIDFGVISGPYEANPNLTFTPVQEIEDIFIAGPAFFHLKDKILDFAQLLNMAIICLEDTTSTRKYMNDYLATKGVILQPEFELAMSSMIVQFVLRNLGIGVVVKDFAKEYIKSGEVIQLQFKECIPKRNFYVVRNEKLQDSVAAARLLDMLLE
jgi:Transcriptional regulator